MCAGASFSLKKKEVSIYLGYYGNSLSVGDVDLCRNSKKYAADRLAMAEHLAKAFTKEDLIEALLLIVDNGDE